MSDKKNIEAGAVVFPPQCSVKLVSHGRPGSDGFYYTWEVKVYDDDLDRAVQEVNIRNNQLKKDYGQTG